jgi:hypothetical protein
MISVLSLVVILFSMAATVAASSSKNYRSHLSGDNEVPVVITNAQGQAIFKRDGKELHYKLIVANIDNVSQAHIHIQNPDAMTGPVVAWLYPDSPPAVLIPGPTNGILAEGVITASDLVGPLTGGSLGDLIAAIEQGTAYVNVHTTANPSGEIRGQFHNH